MVIKRRRRQWSFNKKKSSSKLILFYIFLVFSALVLFYFYLSNSISDTVKTDIKVYFIRGEKLIAVKRNISLQSSSSVIKKSKDVLHHLIAGPTTIERILGIFSEVPEKFHVLDLEQVGKTLILNVSSDIYDYTSSAFHAQFFLAQLVYTLTEINSVNNIKILIDDKEDSLVLGGEGLMIENPLSRNNFKFVNNIEERKK